MMDRYTPPMPIKGLSAPLLRPLPAIFTYADHAVRTGYGGSAEGRSVFTAHLRAFRAMLVSLTRRAGLREGTIQRLTDLCEDLAGAGFWNMPDNLESFKRELQRLHGQHGKLLKDAAREQGEHLRHLFREETGPCRILTIHNDQTWPLAGTLSGHLVDGCWYDCETSHEDEGSARITGADLVLLVAGELPVRQDIEMAVDKADLPLMVLAAGRLIGDRNNMAALRTEHHFRNEGRTVLCGPLAAIRLYQAIDGCRLSAMLGQESFSPRLTETVTA